MVDTGLLLDAVARRLRESQLLKATNGPLDVALAGVSQDSRQVSPGDLFLAWKGADHDAHDFVHSAVERGAVAAVVEQLLPDLTASQLQVTNGRLAGALAADTMMRSPWEDLFLAGVTGTNGKTTVAVLARHLLAGIGTSRAIGTLGMVEDEGRVRPGTEGLTTPGPVRISGWLREMADEGVSHVSLEASSHALAQHRLDGVRLDAAVFTNLSQDHLDYHADLTDYRAAKGRALELLKPEGWAVVNADEEAWLDLPTPSGRTLRFGIEARPEGFAAPLGSGFPSLLASDPVLLPEGSRFHLRAEEESAIVHLPLLGRFNVENALAAAGMAWVAGLGLTDIALGLSCAPQIPGRLERVADGPVAVLIDFAHTPDALGRVLKTLRPLVKGRLLVLFGAGGDRDKGKRPRMGQAVSDLADLSFVTSDNPRTEDPEVIMDDVVAGMGDAPHRRNADRREAIAEAVEEARPGDLILLAGKGHETYQVVGQEKRPFNERAIVQELLGMDGEARAMSFRWTDVQVREALGLSLSDSAGDVEYRGVSTDSRTVGPGDLFLALRGDRYDGHDFVHEAMARGADGAVVDTAFVSTGEASLYPVRDTLEALGNLARHRRSALRAKIVGITGSSGKTSTKDLLVGTLLGGPPTHATTGNLNNRIGLPLTLLDAPDDAEVLVLEMGTNEPGEIRALTEVAQPELGVITTVSETHLEGLGSLEGVLEEKLDLFRGLPTHGLGVVGDEPPVLEEKARDLLPSVVVTGWSGRVAPQHRPESPRLLDDGCYGFTWRGEPVELRIPGRHSVQNALLALAVADALGVPAGEAARRIGTVEPGGMRSEVRRLGQLTLVVDCYNANPQSLRAALNLLASLETSGSRVAVLGSMLELGEEAQTLHDRALSEAMAFPVDLIVATGLFAEAAQRGARRAARRMDPPGGKPEVVIAPGMEEARDVLLQSLEGHEVVLLKASRGVAMETLIPSLQDRFGPGKAA